MRSWRLTKPTAEVLGRFLAEQAERDFSYAAIGATAATPPAGFTVDHARIELGRGQAVFDAAKAALSRWQQFCLGWVEVWPPETPLQAGQVVAVVGRAAGCWWLNACRIVYTVAESGPTCRFGFAYGTLPGHIERGEERFLIEWDQGADRVAFDILAFSQPNRLLARVGYPLVRRAQKRFGREASAAILRAVQQSPAASQLR